MQLSSGSRCCDGDCHWYVAAMVLWCCFRPLAWLKVKRTTYLQSLISRSSSWRSFRLFGNKAIYSRVLKQMTLSTKQWVNLIIIKQSLTTYSMVQVISLHGQSNNKSQNAYSYTPTPHQYSGMFTWYGDHCPIHPNNAHSWDDCYCNPRNSCWNNAFQSSGSNKQIFSQQPWQFLQGYKFFIFSRLPFKVVLPSFVYSVAKNMIMDMADYITTFQLTLSFYI